MIYAISDIHGQYDLFLKLLEKINFSENDELYVIGDVLDRGPDPMKLLLYIIEHKNMHLIMGNHEKMFLDSQAIGFSMYSGVTNIWFYNGGFSSYDQFEELSDSQKAKVVKYLKKCPLKAEITVNNQKFHLVHGKYSPMDREEDMLWGRISKNTKAPEGLIVITGHTPTYHYQTKHPTKIYKTNNIYDIDCGMAHPNLEDSRLACLCLDNLKEEYVSLKGTV